MITIQPPAEIKGHVSQKMIHMMDRVFNGSLETCIVELIQNARRAKATHIDVTATYVADCGNGEHLVLKFHDNGTGLANPQMLVEVAESSWTPDVTSVEDPGGQGFYALITAATDAGVEVCSRDWQAFISRTVAMGSVGTAPIYGRNPIEGTSFEFTVKVPERFDHSYGYLSHWDHDPKAPNPPDSIKALQSRIHEVSAVAGITITFNGRHLPCFDFLTGAIAIEEYRGVRVGIYGMDRNRSYDENSTPTEYKYWWGHNNSGPLCDKINFFGCNPSLHRDDTLPELDNLGEKGNIIYRLKWDITSTEAVKMTLPQRDHIKRSVEVDDLMRFSREFLLRTFMTRMSGEHRMSFNQWKKVKQWKPDLNIPESVPRLDRWYIDDQKDSSGCNIWPERNLDRNELRDLPKDVTVLVFPNTDERNMLAFHLLLGMCCAVDSGAAARGHTEPPSDGLFEINGKDYAVFEEDSSSIGYSWYDNLTFLTDERNTAELRATKRGMKGKMCFELTGDALSEAGNMEVWETAKVDKIFLTLKVPGKFEMELKLPFVLSMTEDEGTSLNSLGSCGDLVHTPGTEKWEDFIYSRIWNLIGCFDDEHDETTVEEACGNVRDYLSSVFHGREILLEKRMNEIAGEAVRHLNDEALGTVPKSAIFRITENKKKANRWDPAIIVQWEVTLKSGKKLKSK